MERAAPLEMRKALEVVQAFKEAGLRFVPVPVLDDNDYDKLSSDVLRRLEEIEGKVKP